MAGCCIVYFVFYFVVVERLRGEDDGSARGTGRKYGQAGRPSRLEELVLVSVGGEHSTGFEPTEVSWLVHGSWLAGRSVGEQVRPTDPLEEEVSF